jgi:hypothetical protein
MKESPSCSSLEQEGCLASHRTRQRGLSARSREEVTITAEGGDSPSSGPQAAYPKGRWTTVHASPDKVASRLEVTLE